MDTKMIERMAREAGFTPSEFGLSPRLLSDLAKFATIVAEECAQIGERRSVSANHFATVIRDAFKP